MPRRNDVISQDDFGRLVAYLQRQGLPIARRQRAIGNAPQGRLVREIVERLVAELRQSPKAQ